MKFGIITPTYNRAERVERCINSVLKQKFDNFEMIVIVDSPKNTDYSKFKEKYSNNSKIKIIYNPENLGVNYSRNVGLDKLSPDVEWVIFLDDDDYFADKAFEILSNIIKNNPKENWIITNRVYSNGDKITFAKNGNGIYSYKKDYLFLRNIKGDSTHCIRRSLISDIRFATTIKQAEEWMFYFDLSNLTKFIYIDLDTTLTDGYANNGLTAITNKKLKLKIKNIVSVIKEGKLRGSHKYLSFWIYVIIKLIKKILS